MVGQGPSAPAACAWPATAISGCTSCLAGSFVPAAPWQLHCDEQLQPPRAALQPAANRLRRGRHAYWSRPEHVAATERRCRLPAAACSFVTTANWQLLCGVTRHQAACTARLRWHPQHVKSITTGPEGKISSTTFWGSPSVGNTPCWAPLLAGRARVNAGAARGTHNRFVECGRFGAILFNSRGGAPKCTGAAADAFNGATCQAAAVSMMAHSGTTIGKISSTTNVAKPLAALSAALPAECCWLHTRTGDGELKLGAHNRFVESGRFGASLHVAACSSRTRWCSPRSPRTCTRSSSS